MEGDYSGALAFKYSNTRGECFRTYNPRNQDEEYVSTYIKFMKAAAERSNFEVKKSKVSRRRLRSPGVDTERSYNDIISEPSGVHGSFKDSRTEIRTYCETYLKKWAVIDANSGINGSLWFDRMHEPRLHDFSESLANFFIGQELTTIRLVFSQAGFLSNIIQLMLVFSALKANLSNVTSKSLIVCAFESDPKVISICFIFF